MDKWELCMLSEDQVRSSGWKITKKKIEGNGEGFGQTDLTGFWVEAAGQGDHLSPGDGGGGELPSDPDRAWVRGRCWKGLVRFHA